MVKVTQEELAIGDQLAKSVFRDNGDILLTAGYKITEAVLRKLLEVNQTFFFINEPGTEEVEIEEAVTEQVANQTNEAMREIAVKLKKVINQNKASVKEIKQVMRETGRFRDIIAVAKIQKSAANIIQDIMGREATMINLSNIRTQSNYHFQHALDVSIVATMLGNKFGYNKYELEEMVQGCLLMDIGNLALPDEIVNTEGRLTFEQFTLLKEHPTLGFTILKENPKIPLISAHVAYQHHERQDGGGYPRRLRGSNDAPIKKQAAAKDEIHRYAEISAVADIYVGLDNPRPGQPKKSPEEVIKLLIKMAGTQLNRSIVDTLITMIPIYPTGSNIFVSGEDRCKYKGYTGIVAKANRVNPERPIIILLRDKNKRKVTPVKIELNDHPEIRIQFQQLGSA
ncbi:MAG: HD domain-containing protein [Fibrobacterales bacterium]